MKKYFDLIIVAIITLGSCVTSNFIVGTGESISQEFELSEFNKFKISGSFEVKLRQGDEQKVVVTGQPNLLEIMNKEVQNDQWIIKYDESVRNSKKTIVEITLPEIERIGITGSGDVKGLNEMDLEHLEIFISGSGHVELFGSVEKQKIGIAGSGHIDNLELIAQKTWVGISGSGNVKTTSEEILNVGVAGSGDVFYKGSPAISFSNAGSGKLINLKEEEDKSMIINHLGPYGK